MNRLSYLWVALVLFCFVSRQAEADPPLAVAPFDSDQAKALQKAWADHLGVPVQITDSLNCAKMRTTTANCHLCW